MARNFSSAAEQVLRTPSAVSMQVKKIEEIIGRPVFERDSRSVSLTPDGIMLLEHARRVLALNNDLVSKFVAPAIEGEIRIGAGDDIIERRLPGMLREFNCTHPGVIVEVYMENSERLIEATRSGEIDLAIVTCSVDQNSKRGVELLATEDLVWAMRKGGIAAEQEPLPLSVWEEGCAWRESALDALDKRGVNYRIAFRSAYIGGQKAAVLSDLAISPIPVTSLGGDIVEAPKRFNLPKLKQYGVGLNVRDHPSDAVRAAADHLRAVYSGVGSEAV